MYSLKLYLDVKNEKDTNKHGENLFIESFLFKIRQAENDFISYINDLYFMVINKNEYKELKSKYGSVKDNKKLLEIWKDEVKNFFLKENFLIESNRIIIDSEKIIPFFKKNKLFSNDVSSLNGELEEVVSKLCTILNNDIYNKNKKANKMEKMMFQTKKDFCFESVSLTSMDKNGTLKSQVSLDKNITKINFYKVKGRTFKIKQSNHDFEQLVRQYISNFNFNKDDFYAAGLQSRGNKMRPKFLEDNKMAYIKSVKIKRECHDKKIKYALYICIEGPKPKTEKQINRKLIHDKESIGYQTGVDLGPKTIAVHYDKSNIDDVLTLNSNNFKKLNLEKDEINRKLDILRRRIFPENYKKNGTWIKDSKCNLSLKKEKKYRSDKRAYQNLLNKKNSIERKIRESKKIYQNTLAIQINQNSEVIMIEEKNIKGLAKKAKKNDDGTAKKNKNGKYTKRKRFGRTVTNYSPASLFDRIEEYSKEFGNKFNIVDKGYCASQYDINGEKKKKSLSSRAFNIDYNNTKKYVQRDLFSAYLLAHPVFEEVIIKEKKKSKKEIHCTHPDFCETKDNFINFLEKQEKVLNPLLDKQKLYNQIYKNKDVLGDELLNKKELKEELPASFGLDKFIKKEAK